MGVDLLAERPDRAGHHSARARAGSRRASGATPASTSRGLALVTGGALGIVWGLVRGNAAGWGSAEVVGSLVAGVLLAAAFVAWELRAREPMLPMRFFRSRAFSAGNAAIFCLFASLFTARVLPGPVPADRARLRAARRGVAAVPWTATLMVCAPIAGALADRLGERPFMVGGLFLQAVGMGWIALIADPPCPTRRWSRRSSSPAPGCRWRFRPPRTRSSASVPVEASARRPAQTARCASWAACSGSRSRWPCSRVREATPRRRRSRTGSHRRSACPPGWR